MDDHTYFIGENGVLVHNSDCDKSALNGIERKLSDSAENRASSKALRKNMIAAGEIEPSYRNAAHHIVAGSSKKAEEARKILSKYNIGINSAENGIFLPIKEGLLDRTF